MTIITINLFNSKLDVKGYYDPGDPGLWTYPNGDPGYPAVPPSFEIEAVYYHGKDITDLIESLNDTYRYLARRLDGILYENLWIYLEYLVLKELIDE